MTDYSYVESLPLEVITTQIIPELSLYDVIQLCQSSTVFSDICDNEYIWKILLQRDFPEVTEDLGEDLRRTYIHLVSRRVPVTLNGDVIGTTIIEFSKGQLGLQFVFSDLSNIMGVEMYTLIFLRGHYPIFAIDTQENSYTFDESNIRNINRILVIPNLALNEFIQTPPPTISSGRGRKPNPKRIKLNRRDPLDDIIENNLFSPSGNPPIYGLVDIDGYFRVLDKTQQLEELEDRRMVKRPKRCDVMWRHEVENILNILGHTEYEYVNRITPCEWIRNRLREIGHLIEF